MNTELYRIQHGGYSTWVKLGMTGHVHQKLEPFEVVWLQGKSRQKKEFLKAQNDRKQMGIKKVEEPKGRIIEVADQSCQRFQEYKRKATDRIVIVYGEQG